MSAEKVRILFLTGSPADSKSRFHFHLTSEPP